MTNGTIIKNRQLTANSEKNVHVIIIANNATGYGFFFF